MEILSSILNATLVIVVVFLPLFFLSGVEGRLLRPLGFAYVVALAASLLAMNNSKAVGALRNGWAANLGLILAVALFAYLAIRQLHKRGF